MPLDPDTTTAVTGVGGIAAITALAKGFSLGRETRSIARAARAVAQAAADDVERLSAEVGTLRQTLAILTGELKSVEERGKRAEVGITTLQDLVRQQTSDQAASNERMAGKLGEILGEMRGLRRAPHRSDDES